MLLIRGGLLLPSKPRCAAASALFVGLTASAADWECHLLYKPLCATVLPPKPAGESTRAVVSHGPLWPQSEVFLKWEMRRHSTVDQNGFSRRRAGRGRGE